MKGAADIGGEGPRRKTLRACVRACVRDRTSLTSRTRRAAVVIQELYNVRKCIHPMRRELLEVRLSGG